MPLANALATLHETQPGGQWLDEAVCMADTILYQFADPATGGFFYTPADHEPLVGRMKDLFDSSTPSGTGLAVTVLVRLSTLADRNDYRRAAERTLLSCFHALEQVPDRRRPNAPALDMLLNKPQ